MRVVLLFALLTTPALAGTGSETFKPAPVAGHPVFDMRAGLSNVGPAEHPYVCAEITPIARFGIELCGNGSGFLHQADVPDLAHFRARGAVWLEEKERWSGALVVGAGLAEVQRTGDSPGFRLQDDGPGAIEAAGPELSVSGKGRYWLGDKAYSVVDVNVGAAYVPGAPSVIGRGGAVLPFLMITAGLGF